jgi:hypothetical protein
MELVATTSQNMVMTVNYMLTICVVFWLLKPIVVLEIGPKDTDGCVY